MLFRSYQNFIFKNYAYVRDGSGTYQSIYGDKLKKVTYWTEEDFKTGRVFESDVPLETRILLDRYEDSDEPSKNHRELFFDIEVEVTDGFPEPSKANNKVTSVAMYTKHDGKYRVYVLGDGKDNVKDESKYYKLKTLKSMRGVWTDISLCLDFENKRIISNKMSEILKATLKIGSCSPWCRYHLQLRHY